MDATKPYLTRVRQMSLIRFLRAAWSPRFGLST